MNSQNEEPVLAETDSFFVWRSTDEEAGYIYHLEMGSISLHLMPEEWEELVVLIKAAAS